jgi:GNAT superfamily N-acetyltransferase
MNKQITEYLVSRLNDQLDNPGYRFEIEECIKPPYQIHVAVIFKSILNRCKNDDIIMVGAAFPVKEGRDLPSSEYIDDLYYKLNNNLIYHLQNEKSHLQLCLNEIGSGISTEYGYCRIGYKPEEDYVHIHDLFVFPEHRNQGRAREILLKAIECIKPNGYDEIQIVCNPIEEGIDKERLKRFYESLGLKVYEYYG